MLPASLARVPGPQQKPARRDRFAEAATSYSPRGDRLAVRAALLTSRGSSGLAGDQHLHDAATFERRERCRGVLEWLDAGDQDVGRDGAVGE